MVDDSARSAASALGEAAGTPLAERDFYREIVEMSSDLVCRYLPNTTLTFVNEAYCRAFGRSQRELIGRSFLELLPPEARSGAATHVASIIAQPRHEAFEHAVVQADGSSGWLEWFYWPIQGHNGSVVELQAVGRDVTARHLAEQALIASESRYRALAEVTSDFVYEAETTPDGQRRVYWASEAITRLTGYSQAELEAIGGTFASLVLAEDRAAYAEHHARMQRGEPSHCEFRIRCKDGDMRWLHVQSRPWPHANQAPGWRRWVGAVQDITERKLAEEERNRLALRLDRERARMDAILDSTPAIVWEGRSDADGTNLYLEFVSDFAERLTGYSVPEWLLRPDFWLSFVHPDDRETAARDLAALVARGAGAHQFRWVTRTGRVIWVEAHAQAVLDHANRPVGIRGVTLDITERVQAAEAVRAANDLLQSTIDALSTHIAILDETGRIIAVNEAWRQFPADNGFSGGDCCGVGMNYLTTCAMATAHGGEARRAAAGLRAVLRGETQDFRMVYRCHPPDGLRWFQMRATRFHDAGGVRLVVAHEDVTDVKAAEEMLQALASRLLESQDDERRRIARELHDTTAQNLFAITINLARIRGHVTLDDRSSGLLEDSLALGEQALQEIRTLSYVLHPPLLDQTGLLPALAWYVDGFVARSGIDVNLAAVRDIGRLPRDHEIALFRVVQECLTNIHRHSGSGVATIRLTRQKAQIVLQVRDQGRGIDPKGLTVTADDIRSLGVGIPGMRQRMRQLGGDLMISSTRRGTTVTATVPVVDDGGGIP